MIARLQLHYLPHSLALPLQTFLYIWIIEDAPLSLLTLSLSLDVVNAWLSDLTISLSLSPSLLLIGLKKAHLVSLGFASARIRLCTLE